MEKAGVIYILTNPSFPEYVKIGYSNQQKRFFTKEKFDEKFQKRIDYFSKVAMSFFANHGYDTEGFTINPYMVVNKVFSSYYKHVQFPIVTFDELKREIQL